jgi:uncharacterized protein YkwD
MTRLFRTFYIAGLIVIICNSCKKDDDWYHITAYEENLHHYVNEYRKSQGKNELVLQPVMVVESQKNSKAWRDGGDPSAGLQERFKSVKEKLGGTNSAAITSIAYYLSPDSVVNRWVADTSIRKILLGVYTQSGPGVSEGDDDAIYITHMFLNIP